MRFTLSWLKEFLDTKASLSEIAEKLTIIGLEVEEIIDNSAILSPFKVAYIKEANKHPEADKLRVCSVDTGSEILQIVCGAPNARAGIKVVLANIGTIIPTNKMQIKLSAIRGITSQGMLCSAEELGIGIDGDGIIEMPADAKLGDSFAEYLGVDDPIIDISITPNRGDCLGVYGIARDLAASGIGSLKKLTVPSITGEFDCPIIVQIEDSENCSKFLGRYFKNVENTTSPEWLQNRLKSIGKTPISALVDITNYISLTFGRPLHVYDADKLGKDLTVRRAEKDEEFLALNDITYKCAGNETIISSNGKIAGFGGIIGGKDTSVGLDTTNVFLEVALFKAEQIAFTGRQHQIDTDARYRFERNIDPLFITEGEKLAAQMILDLCAGKPSHILDKGNLSYKETKIDFPLNLIKLRGGTDIAKEQIIAILERLGFVVKEGKNNDLDLTVPSWRTTDISIKEDIVEEVLRIHGYDNIPELAISLPTTGLKKILSPRQLNKSRIKRNLASNGYFEVVTWSFVNKNLAKSFAPLKEELMLANPISSELDYMRPSIIPNLLLAIQKNKARGFNNLSLFEVGPIFESPLPDGEKLVVSGIRTGLNSERNIYSKPREIDVFDLKADIFSFIQECGFNPDNLQVSTNNLPAWLHPSKSAFLAIGKNIVGIFGELHPLVLQEFGIKDRVVAFEINIDQIPLSKAKKGKKPAPDYSDFQVISRDFAFIISSDVPANSVIRAVFAADKKLIKEVEIFDIYTGSNIEDGKKSIAISVKIQSAEKTLIEAELENLSTSIIASVAKATGGYLRG